MPLETALDKLKKEAKAELPKLRETLKEQTQVRDEALKEIATIKQNILMYELATGEFKGNVVRTAEVEVSDDDKETYINVLKAVDKKKYPDGWVNLGYVKVETGFDDKKEPAVRQALSPDDCETKGRKAGLRIRSTGN